MNAELNKVLRTMEEAVKKHLEEERLRIQKLSDQIRESTENFSQVSEKNKVLLSEIADATKKLEVYKPMDIFKDLYARGNAEANAPHGLDDEARIAAEKAAIPASADAVVEAADANPAADSGTASGLDVNSLTAIPAAASSPGAAKATAEELGKKAPAKARKRTVQKSSKDSAKASTRDQAADQAADWARGLAAAQDATRANENRKKLNMLEQQLEQKMNQDGFRSSDEFKDLTREISLRKAMLNESGGGRKQTRRRKRHSFRRK